MRPDPSTSLSRPGRLLGAAAALGLIAVAMPAVAQDAPALRYLDWNGRPAPVAMARAAPSARGQVPALRPAAPVIPHAGSQSMAAVPQLRPATPLLPGRSVDASGRPGLTPADAFFAPPPTQVRSQPAPAVAAPVRQMPEPPPARIQPTPQPVPRPTPQPTRQPVLQTAPPAAPAPAPTPAPARPAEWADDPNAPRSDALIWSVGQPRTETQAPQPQPQPAAQAQSPLPAPAEARTEPSSQGARYYSVHRQNGRQPDRAVLPEQIYLDALPVEMEETPTSPNMAEPPGPPQLVRNPDGTVRRTTGESARSAASRQ